MLSRARFSLMLALGVLTAPAGAQNGQTTIAVTPDGTSCAQRVFLDAQDAQNGLEAEHKWIAQRLPGYRFRTSERQACDGIPVDIITVTTSAGDAAHRFYFDVQKFPGVF